MDFQGVTEVAFKIIAGAAGVRGKVHEALDMLVRGAWDGVRAKLEEARGELQRVHAVHAELVQQEAAGKSVPVTLLLVHAEDVLMAVSSEIVFAEKMAEVLTRLNEKRGREGGE